MKLITLLSALLITAMATVTVSSPNLSASDPNGCPVEGWQYNVQATGATCDEAKANLYNRLVNMAEQACGGFLQSYTITIDPDCTCSCSVYTATGGVRYCCSEL